jgi:hypothetical protein
VHDWTAANDDMARILAAKGYHHQFVFSRDAGYVDDATEAQTIAEALVWLWKERAGALKRLMIRRASPRTTP